MKNNKTTTIFLVDDDPVTLKVLETQFKERTRYEIKTFLSGEECLKNLSEKPDIIFLDYYLNAENPKANNGLQILDKIKATDPNIEVVMISSQDRLEVAVNCLKHKAFDYIVKSEASFARAQKTIMIIFRQKELENDLAYYRAATIVMVTLVVVLILGIIIIQAFFPNLINGRSFWL